MKYRWLWLLCIAVLVLITGCSKKNEIPKGFSEQSYQDFTKVYSDYQKAKKTNSEDEKGLANLADYHEKKDQGKLTVEEIKVWDAMGELLMIHNTIVKNDRHELDNADSGVKKIANAYLSKKNEIPALEKSIEDMLKLPKSKTAKETSLSSKEEVKDTKDKKDTEGTTNSAEFPTAENCPKPYTKEDCEKFTEYYTNGEGKQEPEKNDVQASGANAFSSDENVKHAVDFSTPLNMSNLTENDRNFLNTVVANPRFFSHFQLGLDKFTEIVQSVSQYPRTSFDAIPYSVGFRLSALADEIDMFAEATINQTMGEGKGGNPYSIWLGSSNPNLSNPQLQAVAAELRQLFIKLDSDCKSILRIYATGQTVSESNSQYTTMTADNMNAFNASLNDLKHDLQNIINFGHNCSVWVKS
ncbi:TPA: hypothetical protein QC364_002521 [Bacillus cereus]|uniref:Lipoprotein n=1 Tax=Bacillus mobilis TaxID=2026190 RepID=A0A1Y5ZG11_9BACI|nr:MULTISPECIES: hypothetical protein [Bacillus]MDU2389327.1 hypothetical protein [Bacillus sp. (in: firmicutes)]UTG84468.1 hypothetical protein MON10_08045 [Bacillus paranthracis]SMD93313.1 hypothetical protein BACERE00185_01811 [Bacillus mobilis]HDR8455677.1 hypothetical protein [Bacillus cereus]